MILAATTVQFAQNKLQCLKQKWAERQHIEQTINKEAQDG
jgi:hypothetical protein